MDATPGPIPLTEQYIKAWKLEDAGDESEDPDASPTNKNPKKKKKKPGKAKPKAQPKTAGKCKAKAAKSKPRSSEDPALVGAAQQESTTNVVDKILREGEAYSPHLYQERCEIFLKARVSEGLSEAREKWATSMDKARMLCGHSVGELKRRRFVAKGVTQNPFAAALGGC